MDIWAKVCAIKLSSIKCANIVCICVCLCVSKVLHLGAYVSLL